MQCKMYTALTKECHQKCKTSARFLQKTKRCRNRNQSTSPDTHTPRHAPRAVNSTKLHKQKRAVKTTLFFLAGTEGFERLLRLKPRILIARRPNFSRNSVPADRFWLKMIYYIIFLTPKPSRVLILLYL